MPTVLNGREATMLVVSIVLIRSWNNGHWPQYSELFSVKYGMDHMSNFKQPFQDDQDNINAENRPRQAQAVDTSPQELLTHPSAEELVKQLDEAERKTNEYWDRILRMQADFENNISPHHWSFS